MNPEERSSKLRTKAKAPPPEAETRPWLLHLPFIPPALFPFHESKAEIRALFGGNGTSKTTSGSWETACYMTGFNPIRGEEYTTPNECWAVCLRLKDQGPVIRDAMSRMLPYTRGKDGYLRPGWVYHKQDAIFEIRKGCPGAGSILRLKQQEDGPEAFFGGRPLAIWVDEEKAGAMGQRNFNQMMARRTPGQPLYMIVTMTPEHGYSWTHSRLYDKESPTLIPGCSVTEVSKFDLTKDKGGYLDLEEIRKEESKYDEYERAARIYGRFTPMGTSPFFQASKILKQMETAPKGRPYIIEEIRGGFYPKESDDGNSTLIRARESGRQYVAAWDPSSGVGGDSSVLVVFDRHELAEVYHASSDRIPPADFALKYVIPACRYFNDARLAVEINGEGGGAALDASRGYENLYFRTVHDKLTVEGTMHVGWRTTDATRMRIFDALNKCLTEGKWIPSFDLLKQMGYVIKKPRDGGGFRPDHPDGKHDDHAVAAGIALAVHYEEPLYDMPAYSRLAARYELREPSGALVP